MFNKQTHTQPTMETFISMNRNINNGKDFPVEMLQVSTHYIIACYNQLLSTFLVNDLNILVN